MNWKVFAAFIAGGVVGGLGTWYGVRKHYKSLADEEIAIMTEHYRKKLKEAEDTNTVSVELPVDITEEKKKEVLELLKKLKNFLLFLLRNINRELYGDSVCVFGFFQLFAIMLGHNRNFFVGQRLIMLANAVPSAKTTDDSASYKRRKYFPIHLAISFLRISTRLASTNSAQSGQSILTRFLLVKR